MTKTDNIYDDEVLATIKSNIMVAALPRQMPNAPRSFGRTAHIS
jgi:hypothetical protein